MKNYKKLFLCLAFITIMLGISWIGLQPKVEAAVSESQAQACMDSLTFIDIAHIACTVPGQGQVIFTDVNPSDNTREYEAPANSILSCQGSGATVQVGANGSTNLDLSDRNGNLNANLDVDTTEAGQTGCNNFVPNPFFQDIAGEANIAILLDWSTTGPTSLDGLNSNGDLDGLNYTRLQNSDPGNGWVLFSSGLNLTSCSGSIIAVNSNARGTAIEYRIGSGGTAFSQIANLANINQTSGCGVEQQNFGLGSGTFRVSGTAPDSLFTVSPTPGDPCTPAQDGQTNGSLTCRCETRGAPPVTSCSWEGTVPPPGGGGGTTNVKDDCYTLGSIGLEWFFCAVLEGIDKAVTSFYGAVQNQLCIQVDNNNLNSVTAGSTGCGEKPNNFTREMHDAWSSMRVIATSLLVVLMLIAIIGQAVGGGRGS